MIEQPEAASSDAVTALRNRLAVVAFILKPLLAESNELKVVRAMPLAPWVALHQPSSAT